MENIIVRKKRRRPMSASQTPESVAARLREQFAPSYLTLTSIIQGVALSALVIRVESVGELLDLSGWLLVAATVLSLLLIWHEYLMQALAYVWMPTLLDSALPFAFLVAELFLTHFVYGNQRAWLLAATVSYTVGLAANVLARTQTDRDRRQNAGVVEAQRDYAPVRLALAIAAIAILLAAWAFYDLLGLDQVPALVSAGALLLVLISIAGTVPYWGRVLAYARREQPAD
jgi:hypothetical protein